MRFEALCLLGSALAAAGCSDNLTHEDDHSPYDAGAGGALSCVPNLDGRIDASEIQTAYNVPISYLISPPGKTRAVDLAGTPGDDGNPVWDLGDDYADDQTLTIQATTIVGKWYEASFSGGQFTTPLDAAATLDAIYASDSDGIELLGLASHDQNPMTGQTLVVYAAPVLVYKLPLTPGTSWVSTGEVSNATIDGLPYAGKDVYELSDDAIGTLILPSFTFTQAHRLRTHLTQTPSAGASRSTQQTSFVFECFGEVARATSEDGETNVNFTNAAELRRFGP